MCLIHALRTIWKTYDWVLTHSDPYLALLYLEFWSRRNKSLAWRWDVMRYEKEVSGSRTSFFVWMKRGLWRRSQFFADHALSPLSPIIRNGRDQSGE